MCSIEHDILNYDLWFTCSMKPIQVDVKWNTDGTVYVNSWGRVRRECSEEYPIIFTDGSGAFWVDTLDTLINFYVKRNGCIIDSNFIKLLKEGNIIRVKPKVSKKLWAFKVSVSKYGRDCYLGANCSGSFFKSGDYFICSGNRVPDITTIRLIPYGMFMRFYTGEE